MPYNRNECKCWCDYPNLNYRKFDEDGHIMYWKCVDDFVCIGKTKQGKTHCKRQTERSDDDA